METNKFINSIEQTSGLFNLNDDVESLPEQTDHECNIDDLKYFMNKMEKGITIPESYLPSEPLEGKPPKKNTFKQAFGDRAFYSGGENDGNNPPKFRPLVAFDIELDEKNTPNTTVELLKFLESTKWISKRFIMKRYLGWTDEEILENERLWKEENPKN